MRLLFLFIFLSLLSLADIFAQKEGQPLADSLEQALTLKDLPDTTRVNILANLSREYRNLMPRKGIEYGEEAEKLALAIHYERKLGEIYIFLAFGNKFYNDIIKSYDYALRALKYNTEYGVTDLIPLSELTIIFLNPNNTSTDRRIGIHKVLTEINSIHDKFWYVMSIGNAGLLLAISEDLVTADSLLKLAITESRKYNFKLLEQHNLVRLSYINFNHKNFEPIISSIKKLNLYFESIGEKRVYTENHRLLADTYFALYQKDSLKKDLDSAEKYAELGLLKAGEINYQTTTLELYGILYNINREKGHLKEAINWIEKFYALNDTMFGENTKSKIEALVITQRNEIAAAQQEKKDIKQRNIRNSFIAGLTGSLLFLIVVYRQRNKISKEKKRSEELLLNILPEEVAEELKMKGEAAAKQFEEVTVMFTDFKDFTSIAEKLSPAELVNEIHECFKAFDNIISKHNIEKIKTIGDSYMCAGGLPVANKTNAEDIVNAALEIQQFIEQHSQKRKAMNKVLFEIRIGIHTGMVVAGIVGIKKFAYDIWGDTVNIASRMESSGESGKVNISGSTYELVKDLPDRLSGKFKFIYRGKISAKKKGDIDMYFVER